MDTIFDNEDITNIIFDYLDFGTLSAVSPVSKQFAQFSKERYKNKLETEIIHPATQMISDYITFVNPHIIFFYNSDHHDSLEMIG